MTTLPNAENAQIDVKQKLHGYCLNPEHPLGKHKAKLFDRALNITQTDANSLKDLIFNGIQTAPCNLGDSDEFGDRYTVDFEISHKRKTAPIRTAWIIKADEDFPRLTTCFVR